MVYVIFTSSSSTSHHHYHHQLNTPPHKCGGGCSAFSFERYHAASAALKLKHFDVFIGNIEEIHLTETVTIPLWFHISCIRCTSNILNVIANPTKTANRSERFELVVENFYRSMPSEFPMKKENCSELTFYCFSFFFHFFHWCRIIIIFIIIQLIVGI